MGRITVEQRAPPFQPRKAKPSTFHPRLARYCNALNHKGVDVTRTHSLRQGRVLQQLLCLLHHLRRILLREAAQLNKPKRKAGTGA